jgi:hypothetical protein
LTFLQVLYHIWAALIATLSAIGLLFTAFDFFQIRSELKSWWKRHSEFAHSAKSLALADHFIAHVIQLGGQFSMVHSFTVRVDGNGGWYLNPANRFVAIGWNRGGDLMHVGVSDFVEKHGRFRAISYKDAAGKTTMLESDICALPILAMKNEYEVRFERTA